MRTNLRFLIAVICQYIRKSHLAPMELPVGIILSKIGAPYFIYLLVKNI
ncbi:iron ABC transporter permease [Peribacillus frigoritolerans]|nr:iron ABC transporter permease [Peribacillus frigoritolerans]MCU6603113.1 iron ABC transporter permease [Peribacillus frigoritolerans]